MPYTNHNIISHIPYSRSTAQTSFNSSNYIGQRLPVISRDKMKMGMYNHNNNNIENNNNNNDNNNNNIGCDNYIKVSYGIYNSVRRIVSSIIIILPLLATLYVTISIYITHPSVSIPNTISRSHSPPSYATDVSKQISLYTLNNNDLNNSDNYYTGPYLISSCLYGVDIVLTSINKHLLISPIVLGAAADTTVPNEGYDGESDKERHDLTEQENSVRPDSPTPTTVHPDSPTSTTVHPHSPTPTTVQPHSPTPTTVQPHSPTPTTVHPDSPTPTTVQPDSPTPTTVQPDSPTPTTVQPEMPQFPICGGVARVIIDSRLHFPLMRHMSGHKRWVWDCAISNCSCFVMTVSSDHSGKLWKVDGDLILPPPQPIPPSPCSAVTSVCSSEAPPIMSPLSINDNNNNINNNNNTAADTPGSLFDINAKGTGDTLSPSIVTPPIVVTDVCTSFIGHTKPVTCCLLVVNEHGGS